MKHLERLRKKTTKIVIGSSAGALGAIALVLLTAWPAGASLALAPSSWKDAGGCNGQPSGKGVIASAGTYGLDYSNPKNAAGNVSGFVSWSGTAATVGGSSASSTGQVYTRQRFDLGPSGGVSPGCYVPTTTHNITVYYNYTVLAAGWLVTTCGSNGTVSSAAWVNITANVHYATPPYYIQGTTTVKTILSGNDPTTGGRTTCGGANTTRTQSVVEVTNTHATSYQVSASGSVTGGTAYDFFTVFQVDLLTFQSGSSGDAAFGSMNATATLDSIWCPAC